MSVRHGSWDSFPQYIRWRRPPSSYVVVQMVQRASQQRAVAADARGQASERGAESGNNSSDLLGRVIARLLHLITP